MKIETNAVAQAEVNQFSVILLRFRWNLDTDSKNWSW